MRCFTMDTPGIKCRDGKINVGESGRSRKLVTVPLPPQPVFESDLKENGKSDLLIECKGDPTSSLVYIPDQSGFRGSWYMRVPRTEEEWDIIVSVPCSSECRMRFSGTDPDCPKHSKLAPETLPEVTIIATGECAQGDAGRMGGGPEYLLVLENRQAIEIVRSGRLYGDPSVIRIECRAGLIEITVPREEAETRKASQKWDALEKETGATPTETTLGWGGGSARHRERQWTLRPHLRGSDGKIYVFEGESIPNIVEVLEDISVTSGYQCNRNECYRVALANGVVYIDNLVPGSEEVNELNDSSSSEESLKETGDSLGDALKEAGL